MNTSSAAAIRLQQIVRPAPERLEPAGPDRVDDQDADDASSAAAKAPRPSSSASDALSDNIGRFLNKLA